MDGANRAPRGLHDTPSVSEAGKSNASPRRHGNRKWDIEDMRALARERGGECLSEVYDRSRSVLWRCEKGHVWKSLWHNVRKGSWCPQCKRALGREKNLEQMRALARSRGGECLSEEYVDSNHELIWRCAQGHVWRAERLTVEYKGSWCRFCYIDRMKHTLADMQVLAERRGGKCLATVYVDSQTKMPWQCAKGHIWQAIANKISLGHWCPVCARGPRKWRAEDMQAVAHARGGRCLSPEYMGSHARLLWECKRGHTWNASPNNVMHKKSWCPQCAHLDLCQHDKSRRKHMPDKR